jgi:UDP-glucose 4-epimerase
MSVLVTGGAGYIGSHMVLALQDAGEQVVVLDDLSTGTRDAVPEGVAFVEGDVADRGLVARTIDQNSVHVIAHFAAKIVVPDSIADPLGYYQANTAKTCSLLASAVATGVRQFIFSSTAAVYGEPAVVPVSEDAVPSPINPYGRSKLMSEWILADAGRAHDLRFVTLRYFNVAGADPLGRAGQSSPHATHLIKVACQVALGLRPWLEVFGTDYETPDGSCLRDYIQVSDLIDAHMAALAYLTHGGHSLTLNCGYGRGYSVLEVIEAVKRVAGCDFEVRHVDRRPGDPSVIVARADRIRRELGWKPGYDDLDTIVRQALAWEARLNPLAR